MIQYWMEDVCVGCGGVYRYPAQRAKFHQRRPKSRLAMRPCPTCGLYQPDMIGKQRLWQHLLLGLGAAGVAAFLGILGCSDAVPEWGTTWGAAAVAVLT